MPKKVKRNKHKPNNFILSKLTNNNKIDKFAWRIKTIDSNIEVRLHPTKGYTIEHL